MAAQFDHEKLRVYHQALAFVIFADGIIAGLPKIAVRDQLDRASTSVVLNIAEGNGKRSHVDRSRFLDMARGSALESAACLDILSVKNMVPREKVDEGKSVLIGIVSMLIGLLESQGAFVREESAEYQASEPEHDHEHEQEHE